MRRSLMTGVKALALAALIATPAVSAADMTEREKQLYEAARANGESVTWYVAHFSSETAEAVGHAFREKYPGVDINVARSTAQVAFNRLSQDLRAGIAQCDVFSTTDVGHYSFLKGEGLLMQYVPENADKVYSVFREAHDPDGYYHITSGGKVLITYNTEMVSEADAPKNWTDLLDPKWKDQVSVGHPAYSGYVGTWVVLMEKLYGWDYFEKLEQNNPQIGRSINDTVTMLNARERAVAAGPEATTLRSASRGNPLAVVYPEDGALLMITPLRHHGQHGKSERSQAVHGIPAWPGERGGAGGVLPGGRALRHAAGRRRPVSRRVPGDPSDARGDREGHPGSHRELARPIRVVTGSGTGPAPIAPVPCRHIGRKAER